MVDISQIPWVHVGVNMTISFVFWWVLGMFIGGSKYAPALIGMTVSGIRAAVSEPGTPKGTLPDNLGVVSAHEGVGYASGRDGWNFKSAALSAAITFVFWYIAAMFLIRGKAWKYASIAATVAAVGGLFQNPGFFGSE